MFLKFLPVFVLFLHHSEGLFSFGKELAWTHSEENVGKPLILTPFIEKGRIKEAQKAAQVNLEDFKEHKSYSGYFTVNKTYDSNMFFWYFPSQTNPKDAPVLIWLQGGPGATSMYGLLMENGPFSVTKNAELGFRNTSWTKSHHVIYFDNPVGTGFSFTNEGGYVTNETQVGEQLYEALLQFFQMFPDLQQNEFYVSGESYGGKYVPAVCYAIHTKNPSAKVKINLKGLAIGDGWTDPENQQNLADFLYQIGLLDENERIEAKKNEELRTKYMKQKQWKKADAIPSTLKNVPVNCYNYLEDESHLFDNGVGAYLNKTKNRKAIHVGNTKFHYLSAEVHRQLDSDMSKSVAPWVSELLSHYRVMTYNGQLDIIVAYILTVNYLQHLKFSGAEDYKTAERHLWFVENELAGYVKQAGNLTEVMVRDAGHMVPKDQPEWAYDLITKFTHNQPFH